MEYHESSSIRKGSSTIFEFITSRRASCGYKSPEGGQYYSDPGEHTPYTLTGSFDTLDDLETVRIRHKPGGEIKTLLVEIA